MDPRRRRTLERRASLLCRVAFRKGASRVRVKARSEWRFWHYWPRERPARSVVSLDGAPHREVVMVVGGH
jgi:hypothetical protein